MGIAVTTVVEAVPEVTGRSYDVPVTRRTMNNMLTKNEWVNRQIEEWGFDYVELLFYEGYEPTLTPLGWRWVLVTKVAQAS